MAILKAQTKLGTVLGKPGGNHRVSLFLGIPYAKPPVGELRWKAPVPAEPWEGERECYTFSPIAMQPRRPKDSFYTPSFFPVNYLPRSEDSLYINVWTPAESPDEKLPVAVWIYGGGFTTGFANKIEFDGEGFGKRGCVFVDFNYRLGPFGFLAHPELTAESPNHVSGNYALMDQILALKWVKENIAAFGGDPDKVTIFGQSAGAMSCMCLDCSPKAEGLFNQVIYESGGGISAFERPSMTLAEAEKQGADVIKAMGFASIEEARKMDGEEFIDKIFSMPREGDALPFRPIVDNYILYESNTDAVFNNHNFKTPFMIGSTANEGYAMIKNVFAQAKNFGDKEEAYLRAAGVTRDMPKNCVDTFGENMYAKSLVWNEFEKIRGGETGYQYYYSMPAPGDDSGAFHSAEHFYIFQTLDRDWRPYKAADYELSEAMADYWANFVKTGDPNGCGLPKWEKYGEKQQVMELGNNIGMIDPPMKGNERFHFEESVKALKERLNK